MADNFLERHRAEYEQRKQAWLSHRKHMPRQKRTLPKPEDESL